MTVYRGHEIERRVTGHAYPRNGNFDNPTERVVWIAPDRVICKTLRAAKGYIDDAIELGELLDLTPHA